MHYSTALVRWLRPCFAAATLLALLAGFATPAEAARFYKVPSGKKQPYAPKRGSAQKVPFANRTPSVKQYGGRFNKPPKNSSPYRRANQWSWSSGRRR